jgi:hypothetical protein
MYANGSSTVNTVIARGIGHRKMTDTDRVGMAADVRSGKLHLSDLSAMQASAIFNVSTAQVDQELRAREEQAHVQARAKLVAQFIESWDLMTDNERTQAVRSAGVAKVWDAIVRVIE